MKIKINIIFSLLSSLIFTTPVIPQEGWLQQTSGTTNDLFDVFCIDQNNCWVVGSAGTILKTTNGGTDWISQSSGTINNLYEVFFINQDTGWTVGQNGTILKSTDGGINWVSQISGTNGYLTSVQFTDPDNGWIAGSNVLKTTDGGLNWIPLGIGGSLNTVFFLDQNTGWLVGDQSIYKTTDGGNNWVYQNGGDYLILNSVQFIDQNFGWAGGNYPIPPPPPGAILVTTNGGTNWINPNSYNGLAFTSIYFTDQHTGWAVALGMYSPGTIHKTTDGGLNWNLQYTANYAFTSVFFTNPNIGWVVASNGIILKTINGGVPVELISFTAEVDNNVVTLFWQTATETNNSGFEILRSTQNDNKGWERVEFVEGKGTTTDIQSYSFTDKPEAGKYIYRLKQIDFDGTFAYSSEIEVEVKAPNVFSLEQNYPNPFNPTTKIKYTIPASPKSSPKERTLITMKIYDILGNEVATLVNEEQAPGVYEVEFEGTGLPSGVYFYQLMAGSFIETKKMVLMK